MTPFAWERGLQREMGRILPLVVMVIKIDISAQQCSTRLRSKAADICSATSKLRRASNRKIKLDQGVRLSTEDI
jgi:hypothetical protein